MKRFTTTLLENMDRQHSVRISISYYSTTRKSSDKVYDSLFLRVGDLVIQIRNLSGLPLHATLRDTSIVLRAFPTFIRILAILSRSVDFLRILRNPLLMKFLNRKKMKKYSLYSMMVECLNLMVMRTECCWSIFSNNVVVNLFICNTPYIFFFFKQKTAYEI